MEFDTKTREYALNHRIAASSEPLQANPTDNTLTTGASVTSDPNSFAHESVRKRWPVILV
jgi:hypothetical protein